MQISFLFYNTISIAVKESSPTSTSTVCFQNNIWPHENISNIPERLFHLSSYSGQWWLHEPIEIGKCSQFEYKYQLRFLGILEHNNDSFLSYMRRPHLKKCPNFSWKKSAFMLYPVHCDSPSGNVQIWVFPEYTRTIGSIKLLEFRWMILGAGQLGMETICLWCPCQMHHAGLQSKVREQSLQPFTLLVMC